MLSSFYRAFSAYFTTSQHWINDVAEAKNNFSYFPQLFCLSSELLTFNCKCSVNLKRAKKFFSFFFVFQRPTSLSTRKWVRGNGLVNATWLLKAHLDSFHARPLFISTGENKKQAARMAKNEC